jgi:hypothetical protein
VVWSVATFSGLVRPFNRRKPFAIFVYLLEGSFYARSCPGRW